MLVGVFLVICCISMFDVLKLNSILVFGCCFLYVLLMVLNVFVRLVVVDMISLLVVEVGVLNVNLVVSVVIGSR